MIAKLQQLAGLAGNSVLPILNCLHYDGKGTFTASDMRNTLSISGLDIGIDKPFCVDAKDFVNIMKGLSGKGVTITEDDKGLLFKSGRSKYRLPIQSEKDFPMVKIGELSEINKVESLVLKDLIQSTIFATDKNELHPARMGIKFDNGYAVATDSHKLVACETELNLDFILPVTSARTILTAFEECDISVSEDEKFTIFESDNTRLVSTKITERYPDWQAVIPKINPYTLTIETAHLIGAISRLLLVSNDLTNTVVFNLGNECSIKAHDSDFNTSGVEELECEYNGEPLVIGFNGRNVLESLKSLSDEKIEIGLTAPNRAGLVQSHGKKILIMPIMVVQ